ACDSDPIPSLAATGALARREPWKYTDSTGPRRLSARTLSPRTSRLGIRGHSHEDDSRGGGGAGSGSGGRRGLSGEGEGTGRRSHGRRRPEVSRRPDRRTEGQGDVHI